MRVIGTAGHVDHGKSTLVSALTGTHPDRLKEEQEREMTIELGFSWLVLPNGEEIGIVDVPGHRDFIENMLAGVGGIDAVMFVVAADEGVMPQTREHLAILDLLQVQAGVIVLTKVDLIDDPEWLDLVELDVHQAVRGTILENSTCVRVSAKTGKGIDSLKQALISCLEGQPARPDLGRPRLAVDRVFTMAGFGTVVTGTLLDGSFHTGDEVEILPSGIKARIRTLQTHKKKQTLAVPGSRTAINLSGVDVDQIQRGDVIASPGKYQPTQRLDVHFRLLKDASAPLLHSSEVKFFLGASEVVGRVRLLGQDMLLPGSTGWLQLELRDPVIAVRGDRYILRRPSPGETLGGGTVVDPQPARRHKRFDPAVLDHLKMLEEGAPSDVFFRAAFALSIAPYSEITARSRLSTDLAHQAALELIDSGQLLRLDNGSGPLQPDVLLITLPQWEQLTRQAVGELSQYHRSYPLRQGMPREALKSRLKLQPRPFQFLLRLWSQKNLVVEQGALVAQSGFTVVFTPQQQNQVKQLLARFSQSPFSPPTVKECQAELGEELFAALMDQQIFVLVHPEIIFLKKDYEALRSWVEGHFQQQETLTVAEFRDRFNTSRRYALAFLEHLDGIGITRRDGDFRKLNRR